MNTDVRNNYTKPMIGEVDIRCEDMLVNSPPHVDPDHRADENEPVLSKPMVWGLDWLDEDSLEVAEDE